MILSPRAWFYNFNHIISEVGFHKCYSNHSVFIHRSSYYIMILIVYVDDILLTESDIDGIEKAKEYLKTQFVTKDMG